MSAMARSQAIVSPLRQRPAWKALQQHHAEIQNLHLRRLFAEDPERGEHFAFEAVGLYFDYSKNRVTDETIPLLLDLAAQSGLRERIDAMFSGEKINVTEKRAVLHVALRTMKGESITVAGVNVVPEVIQIQFQACGKTASPFFRFSTASFTLKRFSGSPLKKEIGSTLNSDIAEHP